MTEINDAARKTLELLSQHGLMVATAESCTGGMIAAALTDIAGSSSVVDRGFVTYSNEAKHEMLGVPKNLIEQHGAVSEQVALAMAQGALNHSLANIAVSVTGVAGPSGGSAAKPVGTVHFACARRGRETVHSHQCFEGLDRAGVRQASVLHALTMVRNAI